MQPQRSVLWNQKVKICKEQEVTELWSNLELKKTIE